jgi:ankyrin repeat protein
MAKGMKPDSVEPGYSETPLFDAVDNGQLEAVRLLLENKANPNAKDAAGKTLLAIAIENKDEATAALLRKYGAQ